MFFLCFSRDRGFFVITFLLLLFFFVFVSGCPAEKGERKGQEVERGRREPVKIVYVDWASEKASSNVVKAVIEDRLGRRCELLPVTLIAMWQSLAAGDQDASVAAWLPSLQAPFLKKYKQDIVNLGPNLEGTRIGLVVPGYVGIDSIKELKANAGKFRNRIIGIDPHAGIMEKTRAAIKEYNLEKFELVSGSGSTMCRVLGNAVEAKRWIAVTGWTPHWKFARWDLKYLEDPKNIYGRKEHISTIARKGLKKDMPEVYAFLDSFFWAPEDMEKVMLMARDEQTTYPEAAREWVRRNKSLVDTWISP